MLLRLVFSLLVLALAAPPAGASAAADGRRLPVPYRSQLDGSPYAAANCGPATMGMVLAAYGTSASTADLRAIVDDLQGTWGSYDSGTFIENLAVIAERYGLGAQGLYQPNAPRKAPGKNALRRWTPDDVRRALDAGYPVVPQVWYRGLPGREEAAYGGDHFFVITGYDGDAFLYNDPIDKDGPGADRRISAAQLDKAWRNSDFPYAALAVVGPAGRGVPPPPTPTPTRPVLRPLATATPVAAAPAAVQVPPATPTIVPPTATAVPATPTQPPTATAVVPPSPVAVAPPAAQPRAMAPPAPDAPPTTAGFLALAAVGLLVASARVLRPFAPRG